MSISTSQFILSPLAHLGNHKVVFYTCDFTVVFAQLLTEQKEFMSNSLRCHELQHTRLPYSSLSFRVYYDQFLEISAPSPNLLVFSVAKSCPTLRLPGWQHTRLPCPSPSLRVCSNSCPLSKWCHLTISSSAALFSFAFDLSQHQGLFQRVGPLYQVTEVLALQHQPFQWVFRVDFF